MHKGKLKTFIKKGFGVGTEVWATPFGAGPLAYTIYNLEMTKKGYCHEEDIEIEGFAPDHVVKKDSSVSLLEGTALQPMYDYYHYRASNRP